MDVDDYIRSGQLVRDADSLKFIYSFLSKARKNFAIANLLFKISEDDKSKDFLQLSKDFFMHDWVIIISYYAMYVAALAAISKLGFKSRSHAATIKLLEKSIENRHITNLNRAYLLSEDLITKLALNKARRESAQYNATYVLSKENALSSLRDAEEFILRIESFA